jgi:hypothetical protein
VELLAAGRFGLTEELSADEELCVSNCAMREDRWDCSQQEDAEWQCLDSLRNRCVGVACEIQAAALCFC